MSYGMIEENKKTVKYDVIVEFDTATSLVYDVMLDGASIYDVKYAEIIINNTCVNTDGTNKLVQIYSTLADDYVGTIGGSGVYYNSVTTNFLYGRTSGTDNAYIIKKNTPFQVGSHQIRLEPVGLAVNMDGFIMLSIICHT